MPQINNLQNKIKKLKSQIVEMNHQVECALEEEDVKKALIKFRKEWFTKGWTKCDSKRCNGNIIAVCEKEWDELANENNRLNDWIKDLKIK